MSIAVGEVSAIVKDDSQDSLRGVESGLATWRPMEWPGEPIRVQPLSKPELLKLRALIVAATVSLVALLVWMFNPLRVGDPLVYIGLTTTVVLRAICWLLEWYNYWAISIPKVLKPRRNWTVDILTTACPDEPVGMIVRTLKAMTAITYPHTNYLCDEGNNPYLKRICDKLGVIHVTRTSKKHAKAGNINNALTQATGQITVILDPDHEPAPYLLDRTLGYFEDPAIGFVQSVQAYRNQRDSFVARAAAEQSYHFYGPYMMGTHGYGTTQAIGANCVFRRAALDSIGGHAPGLAEDMHTSMRLYSIGWRSVYLPEILTRGLVPSTLAAFYRQQIKWACGVFDLLFQEYPRLFRGFTLRQKIHYLLCPVFFLRGLTGLLEFVVPIICLSYGLIAWRATLPQVGMVFLPLLVFGTLVRLRVQRWLMEPSERGMHLAGGLLAIATWWIYLLGVACAVFRVKIPYIPTPKEDKPTDAGDLALPNLITAGILVTAVVIGLYRDSSPPALLMAFVASINALALTYVSIIAQQVMLLKLRRRLLPLRAIYSPIKRIRSSLGAAYRGTLRLVREGWALPVAVPLAIVVSYSILLVHAQSRDPGTPTAQAKEIDVGGFYTGMDLGGISDALRLPRISYLEKNLDFHFRIVSLDQRWDDANAFPMETLKHLRRDGAVPMIKWLPTMDPATNQNNVGPLDQGILKSISDGQFDHYLRRFADNVRAFGEPVLISFAPQADNPKMPWSVSGGNSAADFVAAWSHIGLLFSRDGATNVGWVWIPYKPENVEAYSPGGAGGGTPYFDWIGLSMENQVPDARSIAQMYEPMRAKIAQWHLPVMLTDVSTTDQDSDLWMRSAMTYISKRSPEIHAIVLRDRAPSIAVNDPRAGASDPSISYGSPDDPQIDSFTGLRQKLKLLADGSARPRASDQPLWFDLHPTKQYPRYLQGGPGNFTLMVDGNPFYIKGVAYNPGHDWRDADVPLSRRQLNQDFTSIKGMGGNTIRRYSQTWSDRNIFNAAAENHLKILYGFWLAQDLNYLTDAQTEKTFEQQMDQQVLKYRDDPALLGWCLGNETWGLLKRHFAPPYLTDVRHAEVLFVERMARRIKELDPNHPVFCAQESEQIAGAMSDFAMGAPSVDVMAVNEYYDQDISRLDKIATQFDPARPYVVSEFGPDGYWTDEYNHYDAQHGIQEGTAMLKAWQYADRWREYIEPNIGRNLGGVAYCWSDRYEGTATWFGITDLDGRPKPAYVALWDAWHTADPRLFGAFPYNGPKILNVAYPTAPEWPHEPFIVKADVDPRGNDLRFLWSVTGPGFDINVGHVTPLGEGNSAMIELPDTPGWYRVQLKVLGQLGLDEANVPVMVQDSDKVDPAITGLTENEPLAIH